MAEEPPAAAAAPAAEGTTSEDELLADLPMAEITEGVMPSEVSEVSEVRGSKEVIPLFKDLSIRSSKDAEAAGDTA